MTRAASACLLAVLFARPAVGGDPPSPDPIAEPSYADHPLSWWAAQLESRDGAGVARAVFRMMGADAIPALVAALESAAPDRRGRLVTALEGVVRPSGNGGPATWNLGTALAGLGRLLDTPDPTLRQLVQRMLRDASLRTGAVDALGVRLGSTLSFDRSEALLNLRHARVVEPSVAIAIAGCLADPEPGLRLEAARTLLALATSASPVTNALLAALRSDVAELRGCVVRTLGRVRPVREDVVVALRAALADAAVEARQAAVSALCEVAPESAAAFDALAVLVVGPDDALRYAVIQGLTGLGPRAAPLLPVLGRALFDERPEVREGVRQVIASMGAAAKPAIPALVEASARGLDAASTLYGLAPDAVSELVALLPGADAVHRFAILGPLRPVAPARLVPTAKLLVDSLAPVVADASLSSEDSELALLFLARAGHHAPDEAPAAARALDGYLAAVARTEMPAFRAAIGLAQLERATRLEPELHPFLLEAVRRHLADASIPSPRRAAVARYLQASTLRPVARVKSILEEAAKDADPVLAAAARETLGVILADEATRPK